MAYNKHASATAQPRVSRTETHHPRRVRSFVRREGRLTSGQQHALDTLMPVYGLAPGKELLDFSRVFKREAPVILEIGFGNGDSLLSMAESDPDTDFLGIEVHRPGVGHLLNGIHERQLSNLKVICDDAASILSVNIPNASLSKILLLFPDPWPKKRHHKRRFVQPASLDVLADKLEINGILHMATDWRDYAEHMQRILQNSNRFENLTITDSNQKRPDYRMPTRFEQRGLRLGHDVFDLLFKRVN